MAAKNKPAALVVKIEGSGKIPVYGDGAMRRVATGRPVKVSPAEKAFLDRSSVRFTSKDK